jgi:tetratricopeptide (TPR) repeat protein
VAARSAACVALTLVLLLAGCAAHPARTGSDARTIRIVSHEVAAGESLESIADDFYGDPAAAAYLREVNAIPEGTSPAAGALLDVPVGGPDMERYELRTRAKIHYNRGTLLADRGDHERAAEEFRSALRIDPLFADAGHNLGVVLLSTGEIDRAIVVFRQTADLRPASADSRYALGAALLEAGRSGEALEELERVVLLAPAHEEARYARALALLRLGREAEAIFHLDSLVREFPGGVPAERARGVLARIGGAVGDQSGEGGP